MLQYFSNVFRYTSNELFDGVVDEITNLLLLLLSHIKLVRAALLGEVRELALKFISVCFDKLQKVAFRVTLSGLTERHQIMNKMRNKKIKTIIESGCVFDTNLHLLKPIII